MLQDNTNKTFILFYEALKDLSKLNPFYAELLHLINTLQGEQLENFKLILAEKITFDKLTN